MIHSIYALLTFATALPVPSVPAPENRAIYQNYSLVSEYYGVRAVKLAVTEEKV